jgi:hypothetical protein
MRGSGSAVAPAVGMNNRAEGFTLVEVIAATGILVVGIVTLGQLALLARASNRSAARLTIATVLAQDKLEQLRADVWPDVASDGCCEYFNADGGLLGRGQNPPTGTEYVRRWAIEPVPLSPDAARCLYVSVAAKAAAPVRLVSVRSRRAD